MEISKVKYLFDNKDIHIKKWKSVLSRLTASNKLIEIYSIYCEYRTMKSEVVLSVATNFSANSYGYASPAGHSTNTIDSLGIEIRSIHDMIVELPNIRVKCIDNDLYYNKLHNRFEYLLFDNKYVGTNKELPIDGPDLSISDVLSAFPDDFVREFDMIEYRDKKLNSLL